MHAYSYTTTNSKTSLGYLNTYIRSSIPSRIQLLLCLTQGVSQLICSLAYCEHLWRIDTCHKTCIYLLLHLLCFLHVVNALPSLARRVFLKSQCRYNNIYIPMICCALSLNVCSHQHHNTCMYVVYEI